MTNLTSHPVKEDLNGLKGTARVPGDKSISHRALMLASVANGETEISGLLESEDVLATARALIAMGARITPAQSVGGGWRVRGLGAGALKTPKTVLNLGNSGTSARLLMGLVAGCPVNASFAGDESLSRRPMGRIIKPLSQMGARFEASSADRLPIRLMGTAAPRAIHYMLPVPSAQVKSAILLASLRASGDTTIVEPSPARDHTERMLRHFGAKIHAEKNDDGSNTITFPGFQMLVAQDIAVPSDPSSAAFPTVAALIVPGSDILIPNVGINPLRMGLYETLMEMGADISFENERFSCGEPVADIRVRTSKLRGVKVPPKRAPSMIDEFPALCIAAAFAEGETVMSNIGELRVKESDRLSAMAKGLSNAGVTIKEEENSLTVCGVGLPPRGGCAIEAHLDHRIVMSFLVMGMATREKITVDSGRMIGTSFPGFRKLMNDLGGWITQEDA